MRLAVQPAQVAVLKADHTLDAKAMMSDFDEVDAMARHVVKQSQHRNCSSILWLLIHSITAKEDEDAGRRAGEPGNTTPNLYAKFSSFTCRVALR